MADRDSDGGILARLLTRVAPIEREEAQAAVAAFCLFFCVLGGYFAVRPVLETVGTLIGRYRVANLSVLAASSAFMTLAVVMVIRRFGEYAFVRPGREMLWSRLDTETKYKAKSLIDVPVYRGADALVAQATKGIEHGSIGVATIGLNGAGIAALWAINGWWLGKRHDRTNAKEVADAATASRSA